MKGLYRFGRSRVFLFAMILPVLVYGCTAGPSGFEYRRGGPDAPVIEQVLAAESIGPGTTWRLYLWASDPNGDIKTVTYYLDRPGDTTYSPGHLKVRPTSDGKLQGYLYMNTVSLASGSGWQMWFTVSITVEDAAGNRSLPRVLRVSFNGERQKEVREWEKVRLASLGLEEPPRLGRIHIELVPLGQGVGAADLQP